MASIERHLLRVDLTTQRCYRELIAPDMLKTYLGGRSLGVALLMDYAGLDPFAPEMPLVFTTGLLCNTPVPMSTRCVLSGRSPLTNTIFSCSSGGSFSRHLKGAGIAALVIQGRSNTPCLLQITPDEAVLKPALTVWGLDTIDARQQLANTGAVAVIGPAGEQQVRYASIETSSGEAFSRGGLGAVMGGKGLKAIIVQGDGLTPIADQYGFDKAQEDLLRLFRASPFLLGPLGIHKQGTATLVDLLLQRGMLPGRNFKDFCGDVTHWNAAALRNNYSPVTSGCLDCSVACKRLVAGSHELPEYEALAAFGGLCGLDDLEQIVLITQACGRLGLDPVSTAGSIAALAEIDGQSGGTLLSTALLTAIAEGTGQGRLLGQGADRLAAELGQPDKAMTVKGLELPPFDPRAAFGLALGYAVSPHGGSHLDAWPLASEILRKPVPTDRFSFDGKARIIAMFEDTNAAIDSLVICRFAAAAVELEELAAVLAAVTGEAYSPADLVAIGRTTVLREQAFNRTCGVTFAADCLPERFFSESANGLPPLERSGFDQELAAYHRIRAAQADALPH